jgi:L-amino acid N-acyltransferase YncA
MALASSGEFGICRFDIIAQPQPLCQHAMSSLERIVPAPEAQRPSLEGGSITDASVRITGSMTSIPAASFGERYPLNVELANGRLFELRLMGRADRGDVIAFGRPRGDVPSLFVEITRPGAIDQWIRDIDAGRAVTILAREAGAIVAYVSLHRDDALWTRFAGEIQATVAHDCRGVGLGERMVAEIVVIANGLGLRKVTARVASGRRASIVMFERMGFRPEALLADYLIDPWDETHDLLIMSCDIPRAAAMPFSAAEPAAASGRLAEEPADVAGAGLIEAGAVAAFVELYAPSAVAPPTADDQARAVRFAAVGGNHSVRNRLRNVRALRVAVGLAVFAAAAVGSFYALAARGGGNESQVLSTSEMPPLGASAAAASAPFTASRIGSGRIVIPASVPAVALQVSLDAGTTTGTWFWCFESSFGLSWQEHYCSATGILDAQAGSLLTEGVVRIDPAWPADGVYFIQMYCESACAWEAEVRQR